ncbi:hypothetical protein FJT64_004642 [Amphibalanus amphitrite]|uniref:Uncharacterized protein n=1 Tax=Amphibalanus amphitrite TaxID=1232801 RepID=A0A6A4W2I3_AMPAM|nr:hypothetical protein FJT64_004642 [Amphibalanus amphitrite]
MWSRPRLTRTQSWPLTSPGPPSPPEQCTCQPPAPAVPNGCAAPRAPPPAAPPAAPAAPQRPPAPPLGARMRVVLDKVGKTRSMFQMTPPPDPAPLPDLEQIFTYTRVPDTLRRPGLKFFKRFQTVDSGSGESGGDGGESAGSLAGSVERSRAALAAQSSTLSSNCTLPCRADSKASGPELAELPETKEASGEHSATSNNAKRFPTIYLHYYPETGWAWVVAVCALLARLALAGLHAATGLLLHHCQRLQFQHAQQPELGEYRAGERAYSAYRSQCRPEERADCILDRADL